MRQRGPSLLLGALLLSGCGPSTAQVAGSVLVYAPLVYLLALSIVSVLCSVWQSALPGLRFGRNSHYAALAVLLPMAIYGGQFADADLIGAVLLFYGACVLGWWLLLVRLTVRSGGWGIRWGGFVVTVVLAAPMLLTLLIPGIGDELSVLATRFYLYTGCLGVVPTLLLIFLLVEAASAARAARATEGADVTPGTDRWA